MTFPSNVPSALYQINFVYLISFLIMESQINYYIFNIVTNI